MSQYIQCERCGKLSIELIGDQELACEYCSDKTPEELAEND